MGVNDLALGFIFGIVAFNDWREQKIYKKLLFSSGTDLRSERWINVYVSEQSDN
ncbi:hypothetical protein [Desulfosporosinus nitroreducens]|uniref:Uncharacterized protein n=1 Tax=Desulfosporosinus nitroreducens TaxID=2018668 RepID=A0ABT8QJC3_9FIRM|nr:hypothetical protein [Desulfosporosinus nitroreducens]MDO0821409.1 hypothetical protein [Desulfosporosinus nitroreducens]